MIRQEINVRLEQLVRILPGEFAEITTGRGNKQPNYNKLEVKQNKKGAAFLPMRHPFPTLGKTSEELFALMPLRRLLSV
ncbi:MAG TPA: hypothetical protein DC054_20740 [Blastocatellia bacterium]|nr:hypothetical protein [Blastocatellia bacterium]